MAANRNRIAQQLRSFDRLLADYDWKEPLARFLTRFFKENRQMGSNDRRTLSRWIYSYCRIGNAVLHLPAHTRLVIAELLCHQASDLVTVMAPEFDELQSRSIDEKIAVLHQHDGFDIQTVFPLLAHTSAELDQLRFLKQLFVQPDLFIRLLPDTFPAVVQHLDEQAIAYRVLSPTCIALPNGTQLNQYPALAGTYQVQDWSSQQTGAYFEAKSGEYWWDACAASGGKSLLLMQSYPHIHLLVSDVRSSILRNLDERFDLAGMKHYRKKLIDLTKDPTPILGNERFDGIILDAPCSGSGTWGRTPEMMRLFDETRLQYYVALQQRIATHIIPFLKPNAPLIYITCSVYADENEQQVNFLQSKGLTLERMALLKGYENRADTMFVARLIK